MTSEESHPMAPADPRNDATVSLDSQLFYEQLYRYSNYREGITSARIDGMRVVVRKWMNRVTLGAEASVLEVGAGHGALHDIHPRWRGIEYSATAVEQGKSRYGAAIALEQGDATALACPDSSVDFLFTFATLEHVPEIEIALEEFRRVLTPGGTLVLAPAWNCRPWTVAKLAQRPYSELAIRQKIGKALIPVRENLAFRMAVALPMRFAREALSLVRPVPLQYRCLYPDASLIAKYSHVADDDAFVSIDAHAALVYLTGRGFESLSHPHVWQRLICRGEPVVMRRGKP